MRRRLPPLNALRAFEAAARHGSFALAAGELGVTAAAVSQQVKGLEAQLQMALFRRQARGLTLTNAGRAYLPGLSAGLDRLAAATAHLREGQASGLVTLTTLASFAAGWLVPRLARFRQQYPGIDLRIDTSRRLVDFAREDIDLAIRFGPGPFKGLEARRLLGEEVFPVASPALLHGGLPLQRFEDLAQHQLLHDVDAQNSQPWMSWTDWFRRAGLSEAGAARGLYFTDSNVLVAAAVAGQGVALGRGPHLGEQLAKGHLVRLFEQSWTAGWSYFIVAPPAQLERPLVQAVAGWLEEEARRGD
jgi:LysR family glycine cleavage system transcriptional activator